MSPASAGSRWVKVLDQSRCIGCHACTTACKSENDVPLGVTRTYVKSVDVGTFPQVRRTFQVTRCNQCADAPCVAACPTRAMYRRPDGIVDFDKSICIGCKACMAACPYDAIFINPEDHSAEKCNFCAHRLEAGLEPACVVVCPTQAILVGDLSDPGSKVAEIVQRQAVTVRRPEKETRPGVFYKGAHQATLDPLAARRPSGGLFAWSVQGADAGAATDGGGPALRVAGLVSQRVGAGHPGRPAADAPALLSYDIPHQAPWGWRVSLYTWTKGIAAGGFLIPLVLAVSGVLPWGSPLVRFAAPSLGLGLLGMTGALLIWDLKHPARFVMIFTRHQPTSWLVKGSLVLAAYGAALCLYLVASALGSTLFQQVMAGFGLPLSVATASYTAYLFAQAKGRDLWQSPLLAPHMAVQAGLVGSAAMLALAAWLGPGQARHALAIALAASAGAHLLLVSAEVTLVHPTAHAHLAVQEMTKRRFAPLFWAAVILCLGALAAPWITLAAVPLALIGLLFHEHAYVQAGQAVPLA